MTRVSRLFFALLLLAVSAVWGQAPAASATIAPGTTIRIQLQKKVDTKKAKVGDKIIAKVNDNIKDHGATLLPKNSLLVGEVTLVAPATKQTPAKLGVLFDQATTQKGQVLLHLRAAIVRVMQDDYSNGAGMLSTPAEMGGSGTAMVMDPGNPAYANLDRASNGIPIQYSVMETANGSGADLGGVIYSVGGDFSFDQGAHLQVRVLH